MNGEVDVVEPLGVYSGKCLEGICGQPAGFKDMSGDDLFVGDIVLTFHVRRIAGEDGEYLEYFPDSLTAVVADDWISYSDGTFVRKDGNPTFFVMGIRSVPMDNPGEWRVKKLKSFADVVSGENWNAFGFNYGPLPDAALSRLTGAA